MSSGPEFYLTLALRCREVASMVTRVDLRERLERIIADLEAQAAQAAAQPAGELARK
jgi:hypothetical protein